MEMKTEPARLVRWAGLHSLMLYLNHQPILFGLLYGVAALVGAP